MSGEVRAPVDRLAVFCGDVLRWAGADAPSADAATRAMMHGSVHGVDSHGVRLLEHYARALMGGRINPSPTLTLTRPKPATGVLEADDAHGALATYVAMDHACDIAAETGIAAVGIRRSSHFGPAGAYTLHAAKRGYIALATCNSDSFVRLHDGAAPYHGTNPISMAAPAGDGDPWLLDMATSSVPFNRVRLYQSLNLPLPDGAASDGAGADTNDPRAAEMLAPVGGAFGFKGAGLGGMAEILSQCFW